MDDSGKSDLFVSANVAVYDFVPTYRLLELGKKKIAVTSVLGKEHLKGIQQNDEIKIEEPTTALKNVVDEMKKQLAQKGCLS